MSRALLNSHVRVQTDGGGGVWKQIGEATERVEGVQQYSGSDTCQAAFRDMEEDLVFDTGVVNGVREAW